MELSIFQEIFAVFAKANRILIVLPKQLSADNVSAGLAMANFLSKQGKDILLVAENTVPSSLEFLPKVSQIQNRLDFTKSLVISVATGEKQLDEISYEKESDKLKIFLKAKNGFFEPQDINFEKDQVPIDAVVFLGLKSLEEAGAIFEKNTEMLYEIPKINIDHQAGNEYFGNINLVEITATSLGEILSGLFEKYETQLIDEDIATCLLAGIIFKTNSFQHVQTTPRAFLQASQLIALGGRQQEIVKNIFKTKSLSLLKLWGRALAKLKIWEDKALAIAILNQEDIEKSQGSDSDLVLVVKELLDNMSDFKIVGVLLEKSEQVVRVCLAVHTEAVFSQLTNIFGKPDSMLETGNLYKVYEWQSHQQGLTETENQLAKI